MKKVQGFSLIEMLLVSVIIMMVLYGVMSYYDQKAQATRIDRTAAQMQQILNAAMSYYVMNGKWPPDIACLQGGAAAPCQAQYLPKVLQSPWSAGEYIGSPNNPTGGTLFYVYTTIKTEKASTSAMATAGRIAGMLPNSYTSADATGDPPAESDACASGTSCTVVASVNIPGDSLNNARAVNFAGLYKNGACIPVPTCPVDPIDGSTMVPQVFVAPVSISGKVDNTNNVYPVSSFTAYAKARSATPAACDNTSTPSGGIAGTSCGTLSGPAPASGEYWRACLQVVTERGPAAGPWGGQMSILAFTRCAIPDEPAGSSFTVYQ